MAITGCFMVSFIILSILHCRPVSANWNGWDGEHPAKCTDFKAQNYSGASINISLDLLICLMPLPQLVKLNLTSKKKISIMLMFSVGLL